MSDVQRWVRFTCALSCTVVVLVSCSSGGGGRDAFCSDAEEFVTQEAAPSPERADRLSDLADDAPDEIADDAEVLAQVADRLAEEGGAGAIDPNDPTASLDWLRDLDLDAADVARAASSVQAYATNECGVNISGGGAAESTTTVSP